MTPVFWESFLYVSRCQNPFSRKAAFLKRPHEIVGFEEDQMKQISKIILQYFNIQPALRFGSLLSGPYTLKINHEHNKIARQRAFKESPLNSLPGREHFDILLQPDCSFESSDIFFGRQKPFPFMLF